MGQSFIAFHSSSCLSSNPGAASLQRVAVDTRFDQNVVGSILTSKVQSSKNFSCEPVGGFGSEAKGGDMSICDAI